MSNADRSMPTSPKKVAVFLRSTYFVAAVGLVVVGVIGLSALQHWTGVLDSLRGLSNAQSTAILVTIGVLALAQQAVYAQASIQILPVGNSMRDRGRSTAFSIMVLSAFINAVAPAKAGTVMRIYLFRDRFGLEPATFVGSQAFLAFASMASAASILGFTLLVFARSRFDVVLLVAILVALALGVIALKSGVSWLPTRWRQGKLLRDALAYPATNHIALSWALAMSVLQLLIISLRVGLALYLIGGEAEYWGSISAAATLAISPLISVLPGGLGTRELMLSGGAFIAGVPVETAVAAALIDRVVGTVALGICAPIAASSLAR